MEQALLWGRHYVAVEPTHFRVDYSINPFMDVAVQPDRSRARDQWERLRATLEGLGATVEVLPARADAPDMVYAMNLGLGLQHPDGRPHVVLSHMRHPERRTETAAAEAWFAGGGFGTAYVGRDGVGAHFEAGDAFAFGDALVVGYGPRTEELALKHLAAELGCRVRGLRISHPGMYHLDLAFCPLTATRALVCPAAFDEASAEAALALVPEPLVLTEDEALSTFCANSVVVGRTVVMPGCPDRVRARLERWGLDVVVVDVSEFHKGGGSVRCLTNPVDLRLGRDLPLLVGGQVVLPSPPISLTAMTRPLRPRPTVLGIPAYVAGRPPTARPGLTTYKLSSNENPYPPLPGVVEAAAVELARMNRYPDLGSSRLYAALAGRLRVAEAELAVATGSVALIYQLLQAFCDPGDEVVHAWRSFEAYPIAAAAAAATSVPVPVTADGRHDLDAMAAAVTDRTRVVLVCTPNNPTGPAVGQAELTAFLARLPEHVLVVVDEAYVEFVRMEDPVDGLTLHRTRRQVVLTRTFSKAYGLAGLRVGYAVADPSVAAALRAVSLPFGVSGVAEAAALASLDREDQLLSRVAALVVERGRVVAGLRTAGWQVPDPQGNFVWLALGERTLDFADAADRAGLMVRPFAGDGVRASIGETEANDRLVEVAAAFV